MYKQISGIYIIYNNVTLQSYIGKSISVFSRINSHKNMLLNNKHSNNHLQNSFNKYGINNFEFDILDECEVNYLSHMENYWCNILNTHNNKFGYNIDFINVTDQKNVRSLETKLKMSKSQAGKKRSNDTKQKMSEVRKNKAIHTKESISKIIESNKRRKYSEKTLIKMSNSAKNRIRLNKPKNSYESMSEEARKLRSEKVKKKILQYDLQGNFIREFKGAIDAVIFGFTTSGINSCCKKKIRKHKNYVFKYAK